MFTTRFQNWREADLLFTAISFHEFNSKFSMRSISKARRFKNVLATWGVLSTSVRNDEHIAKNFAHGLLIAFE